MASVRGSRIVTVVPLPFFTDNIDSAPQASIALFTTSIPTPRPDTLVTSFAVEKPRRKDIIEDLFISQFLTG